MPGTAPPEHTIENETVRGIYAGYASDGRGRLWDLRNPGYARLAADRDRRISQLVAEALPTGHGRVIDIGCGTGHGRQLVANAAAGAEYTGLDLLEERIAQARVTQVGGQFIVASADAMPLPAGSFDVALAITLFSSLPTQALEHRVASEIARVLRPGGWLIWYDLRYDNPSNPEVHGVTLRRVRELFPGWDGILQPFTLAPPVARRLGRLTPVLYPLLHAIPPLRSHLIGRLRCPG